MEQPVKKIKKAKTRSLVNVNPTHDSDGTEGSTRAKGTLRGIHESESFLILLEKAKASRRRKPVVSSRTSNRALGQLQFRQDEVGHAARIEKKRREALKKPKITDAMATLRRHLKGEKVPGRELLKVATVKPHPRTIRAAIKRAGSELEHESQQHAWQKKIEREARKAERERIARLREKQEAKVRADARRNARLTKAKQTLQQRNIAAQAATQAAKQFKLPPNFDPYHHYMDQTGRMRFWEDLPHARGKQRPIPNQRRALQPKDAHAGTALGGLAGTLGLGKPSVEAERISPPPPKTKKPVPNLVDIAKDRVVGAVVDRIKGSKARRKAKTEQLSRDHLNKLRTIELMRLNRKVDKYMNKHGEVKGLNWAMKETNKNRLRVVQQEIKDWEEKWRRHGFKPTDPHAEIEDRFAGQTKHL